MNDAPFYQMVSALRQDEVVILSSHDLYILPEDRVKVTELLANEYLEEAYSYPYTAPGFDAEAALWASEVTYLAAQLILNRQHAGKDLPALFPAEPATLTPSAILSADLMLRFLPQMVQKLRQLDIEDELIPILENLLIRWHYSGIEGEIKYEELKVEVYMAHSSLRQLYIDRVIAFKNLPRAMHPTIHPWVKASLGIHQSTLWKEFDTIST